MVEFEMVADGLGFPEGPAVTPWGTIVLVEARAGRVTEVDPATGARETFAECGGGPAGSAFGPDGALYLCNFGGMAEPRIPSGIQRVDVTTREVSWLYRECDGAQLAFPNDLVFDASGGFWFTDTTLGALFYATADGARIRRCADGLPHANGVGLAPDGSEVYVAASGDGRLHAWKVTAPGEIVRAGDEPSGSRIVWDLRAGSADAETSYDSMALEQDGSICVGLLHDGGVGVFSPAGAYVERHAVPLYDWAVTNICFGGPDLRTAFVTSGDAGRLYRATWPRPGLRLAW